MDLRELEFYIILLFLSVHSIEDHVDEALHDSRIVSLEITMVVGE